jgi:GNAT superfamily N-acetyltransferase
MISTRPATIGDAALLTELIRELAVYDRMSEEAMVIEDDVVRDGFGETPKFRAVIAESDRGVAGYALFFPFYSSFQGHEGLFMDDIYVRPEFRGHGVGEALLAHIAGVALREGYFCVRCEMLEWNKPAIDFCSKEGAVFLEEWKAAMFIGDALQAAASKANPKG